MYVKLSLCSTATNVSTGGGCTTDLHTSSENFNTLDVLCFASQRSFLQKTKKTAFQLHVYPKDQYNNKKLKIYNKFRFNLIFIVSKP